MVYQIALKDRNGQILTILESDNEEELTKNPWFRGRILFPFNDRIPEGKYNFREKEFQLSINNKDDGSAFHGLVYNQEFIEKSYIADSKRGEIRFSFLIKSGMFSGFPFSVSLDVRYSLRGNEFSVQYFIRNYENQNIPVALGWHPYFTLPGDTDNLELQAGGGEFIAVDNSLNPTGEILPVKRTEMDFIVSKKIGKKEIDIALTAAKSGKTLLTNGRDCLKLQFDRTLFPYLQLFIPPGRKSIAIEPVTSATNSFNIENLGKIVLKPGEEKIGFVIISL